ncbi:hypothetical protein JYA63_03435 [Fictibacillus nanhaiensis]|uniref:Uncharacterized protein n=1 Tax=Fictibacillus nanhaiensis TaxID=742169 RepID=A0ABS2ZMP4_9BACL|nr:hypothetical protein [Fictibacillus nanhaiensis]
MSNQDRLDFIRNYYANQEKVKVEVLPSISKTTKGNVVHKFNGKRAGYEFKHGVAYVDAKDVHLFRNSLPYMVIHDKKEGNE